MTAQAGFDQHMWLWFHDLQLAYLCLVLTAACVQPIKWSIVIFLGPGLCYHFGQFLIINPQVSTSLMFAILSAEQHSCRLPVAENTLSLSAGFSAVCCSYNAAAPYITTGLFYWPYRRMRVQMNHDVEGQGSCMQLDHDMYLHACVVAGWTTK